MVSAGSMVKMVIFINRLLKYVEMGGGFPPNESLCDPILRQVIVTSACPRTGLPFFDNFCAVD